VSDACLSVRRRSSVAVGRLANLGRYRRGCRGV